MRLKRLCAIGFIGVTMLTGALALGQALKKDYKMELGLDQDSYVVNGESKPFDKNSRALTPMVHARTGEMLLPLRLVVEELGGALSYNPQDESSSISYKGNTIVLKPLSHQAKMNGENIFLSDMPMILEGSMYVTPQFISNTLGVKTEWVEAKKQIVLKVATDIIPLVNFNRLEHNNSNVRYSLEYPVISGLNDKQYEKELNTQFFSSTNTSIDAFLESAATMPLESFSWQSDCTVTYRSAQLISWLNHSYIVDKTKSASVKNQKDTVTIDLQTQRVLNLEDLFKNGDYIAVLEKEIKDLLDGNPQAYAIKKAPQIYGDMPFYCTGNSLVISVHESPDKPYTDFNIPYDTIKNLLKSDYRFLIEQD